MKRYIRNASNIANIEVLYESYERYGKGKIYKDTFTGIDNLEALKKMCDDMQLYLSAEEIDEEGMDVGDVVSEIYSSNGDGCDFIIYIKDLNTGEFLLKEEYEE